MALRLLSAIFGLVLLKSLSKKVSGISWISPTSLVLLGIIIIYTLVLHHLLQKIRRLKKSDEEIFVELEKSFVGQHTAPENAEAPKDFESYQQERIKQLSHELEDANRKNLNFQKFIPKQFVDHFAKYGMETLELGRADEDEVAILFCDIRGFTGLSERMTPQELMNFLNSYFIRMNAPIHKNNGFIDKFIGDAVMALFDHPGGTPEQKATDALNAALDLRKEVFLYNQHRANSGYPPINIGIGIHFGPVVLGTVGSTDRMDTTVIGDNVNIAYRLETLTPIYDAEIIVSSTMLDLTNAREKHKYRLLDYVRVKGKQRPVEIYEIIDHQPQAIQQIKLSTAELLEKGLECRIRLEWQQAIEYFKEAYRINPEDQVINRHLENCYKLRHAPLPEAWDGAVNV